MIGTQRPESRLRLLKPISKSLTDVPDLVDKIQKLSQDAILEKYNNKIKGTRKRTAHNKFHEVVKNYADIALYEIQTLENKATKKQAKLFEKARDMIRQLYVAATDFEIMTVITTTTLSNSSEHKGGNRNTNSYFLNLIKIVILAYIAYYAVIAVQDPIYYDTLYNQVCKTNETVTEEVIPKNILKLQFKETVKTIVNREPTCSDIFQHFFHDTYNLIAATVILFSIVFCIKNTKDILGLSNDATMDLTVNTVRIGTSLYATKNDIKRIQEENKLRKQNNLVNAFGGYGAALLAVATGRYGEALGKTVEATKEFRDSFQDFGHKERIEKAKLNFVNEAVDIMSRNPIRKAINNESEKPYTASAFVAPADLPKPPPARVERKTSPQQNATSPPNQTQTKLKSKSPEVKPKSKSPEPKQKSKSPEPKQKSKTPESTIKKGPTDEDIEIIIENVCHRAYDDDEKDSCQTTLTMYFDIDDIDERINRFTELNDFYALDDDDEFLTALGHLETSIQAGLGGAKQKKRKYKRRI